MTELNITEEMIVAIATEVRHALALGKPIEAGVRAGLSWSCWQQGPWIKTAAELRADAKHDTSCVGAFARARPK